MAKKEEFTNTESDGYVSRYSDSIKNVLNSVLGGKKTQYVPENDATYNYYKKSYEDSAKKASEHAAGLSTELTGGYGNSYGMTAAENAYSKEMQKLSDLLPKLEQQYYDRQKADEDSAFERLGALMKLDAADYERYNDSEARKLAKEKQERAAYENDRDYARSLYESDRKFDKSVSDSAKKDQLTERELAIKEKSAETAASKSSGSGRYAPKSDGSFSTVSGYNFLSDYGELMHSPEEYLYALVDTFGDQDGFYKWIKHVVIPYDSEGRTFGELLDTLGDDYDLKPSAINVKDKDAVYRNAQLGAMPPMTYKV